MLSIFPSLCIKYHLLTKGVSAPPTIVIPKDELVRGISTCDTSPSNPGNLVIPARENEFCIFNVVMCIC